MRLSHIDRARGFAMCCVVAGHIFSLVNLSKPEMNLGPLIRIFSVFELVIFFVISGYLFQKHPSADFGKFAKKKAKGLLIPYFVFSILNILFFLFVEPTEGITLSSMTITTLSFYGISVLWFFPTLFIGEIFWCFLYKKLNLKGIWIAAALMVLVGVFYGYLQPFEGSLWTSSLLLSILGKLLIVFARGIICLFFVGIGHFFGYAEEKWNTHRFFKPILWIVLLLGFFLAKFVPAIDLRELGLNRVGLWSICAIMISLGLLFFFEQTMRLPLKFFEIIGQNTLIIMCTHLDFKLPIYCMMCAEQLVAISPRAKNYVYWGTLFLTLVLLEIVMVLGWKLIKKFYGKIFAN